MVAEAAIGCDPIITYTLFPDVTPRDKTERADVPWSELVGRIVKAATYIRKSDCPLISLAEYGDLASDAHCIRHAANVRRIFGVEVDYDGEEMPPDEAAALLANAHLEAVIYTSPSHTPERPRWRVLLPLSEPAMPGERATFVGRVNSVLKGGASRESFTLSQSFYIGRVRGAPYVVIPIHGRPVDLAAELEPLFFTGDGSTGKTKVSTVTDAELRERFRSGDGRYEAMLSLSARWAARGMSATDIAAALTALLEEGNTTKNADGVDLLTRVEPMASSAVAKFGETRRREWAPEWEPVPVAAYVDEAGPEVGAADPDEKPLRAPLDWRSLETRDPPVREWAVEGWLGRGHVTLLAGPAGSGKTAIAQSIASCVALGRSVIDTVPSAMNALLWAGEDEADELWRRQISIARWLEEPLAAFADKLILQPYPDRDMTLAALVDGRLVKTAMLTELREQIGDYKAGLVFVDSVARCFGGNENDRHQVTQFVSFLTWALEPTRAALCLLGHPAKALDSEYSGSTAWEASVRAQLFFGYRAPGEKADDEAPVDENRRVLAKRKTNYSGRDLREVRFADGCMQPANAPEASEFRSARSTQFLADEAIRVFRRLKAMGIDTSAQPSVAYLPRVAAKQQLLEHGLTERDLRNGLAEAMKAGRLRMGVVGKYANRNPRMGLTEDA